MPANNFIFSHWDDATWTCDASKEKSTSVGEAQAIQADCDIKAINIILQGLPTEIYALVSQHRVAKDLWEKIKLLMKGTSLTKQEQECKDEFDKFTYKKGESLHEYYLRFTLLLNDMNIYKMPLEQFQVNTKFLNTLPDEWSKFVTDVKLVKDLHTTNVDQLHAYLEQHERHANEVCLMHERNSDPLALVASHQITQSPYQTHQHTYQNTQLQPPASTYPSLQYGSPYQSQQYSTHQSSTPLSKGDDPIDAINHMMSFLTAVVTSCYPTTNNQLRNSSNPRQQATINNGRVTLQPIQGRQTSFVAVVAGTRWRLDQSDGDTWHWRVSVRDGILCRRCSCGWCGNKLNDGFCSYCASKAGNSFAYDPNPNSFDNSPNFSYAPPQPQFETYSCELCGNDSHYGYDCPSRVPLVYEPPLLGNQKLLMEAIDKRNGRNKKSQKVQRTLLKQQYGNFAGSSLETMDQTFDSWSQPYDVCDCAFLASQPNSPQLAQEDLEQIDPDDLEEIDLQWEMVMLTIRARRFIKRTDRKLDVNGQRVGFDSYQAEEEHPTNFALMAHTSSGSSSSSESEVDSCSKSCVKAYATLKEQYDSLSSDYKRSQFNLVSYKAGLESVEARLANYKKNEVVFEESINVLKLEVKLRDTALVKNKKKLEKAEKEKDELKLTLEKFQNPSKSLNNLLESQVIDKFKTGLGYNAASSTAASPVVESFVNSSEMLENQENNKSKSDKGYHVVPPPYTGNFIPFKPDLTFMDEIVKSENMDVTTIATPSNDKKVESNHESAGVKSNGDAVEPKTIRKNSFRPPVIEDWNSDDESEVEIIPKVKIVSYSTEKIKFVKSARETVETVETSKQNKHYPRGNQRNWNNLMSQRLESDFKMINKACFVCGSFEHLHYVCDKKVIRPVWNNSSMVNHKNFANKMAHPHPNRSFVPQAVLTRSGKINIVGANVNTVVRPVNTAGSKPTVNHPRPISNAYKKGYSQVTRPFNKYSEYKNSIFNKKVNTVRVKDITARDRAVGNPQQKEYKEKGVIDSGTLDFDNVYFCKELKYNLFSVSQICDKKNNVLFTDTECLVLSSDFKLLDESQVLLRVPRKDNIYSVDLKSVVPTKGLTCLFAKATIDESNLWHRRLGHINFKNMNKLVRGNLVRGLPSKIFENDHSCVACQKGKQHKASNQTNGIAGTRDNIVKGPKDSEEDSGMNPTEVDVSGASDKDREDDQASRSEFERLLQQEKQTVHPNSTNSINTVSTPVSIAEQSLSNDAHHHNNAYDDEDVGAEANLNNLGTTMNVSPIPTTRIDKDHPKDQIIGDLNSAIQTRRMTKISDEHAMNVWTLVDLPNGKRAIGTKWVFRNKKDKRGIVVRNKAGLVAQGYTQEEGINYDEVFAPVAKGYLALDKEILQRRYVAAANCCQSDKTVYKEWEDRMERDATTASSLEAEYDSGNINRTQSMATFNEPSP
ncbi:ribonuclease H-like domain-containing protein [Tanacetum coccineum]